MFQLWFGSYLISLDVIKLKSKFLDTMRQDSCKQSLLCNKYGKIIV